MEELEARDFGWIARLSKKPFVYLSGEHLERGISPNLMQHSLRKGRPQEVVCQVKTKKEHSLAAQRSSPFHNLSPVHLLMGVDQLGNVAKQTQMSPEMLGTMHAKD